VFSGGAPEKVVVILQQALPDQLQPWMSVLFW